MNPIELSSLGRRDGDDAMLDERGTLGTREPVDVRLQVIDRSGITPHAVAARA